MAIAPTASADKVPTESGWNLDNVTVTVNGTGSSFNPIDGTYVFGPDSDYTYEAAIDNGQGEVLGLVLAKPWPVGEPPGIKIVNDDIEVKDGRPTNCIMATSYLEDHYLDSPDPQQVVCSSPFQSHKRFKVAMLPTTVDRGADAEEGIDLVFDVESEEGSRDYQIFQKINNWTGERLDGFTVEVGTGLGADFVPASDGVGLANLSLSVPEAVWAQDQLATFSAGLFGPIDTQHDRPAGFFDPNNRSGFTINEYPNVSGDTDTLTSGAPLAGAYNSIPEGAVDQFGPWLPNSMLPTGIFWDDDGNPETDAQLVAWYGSNPDLEGALGWMTGAADGFAAIPDATLEEWGQNLEYTMGEIDDLVNIGLNYIVTVGDLADSDSFTIRVTPSLDTSGAGTPAYVGAQVTPPLEFLPSDAAVALTPEPTFPIGGLLTARVGDADGNQDPEVAETVEVDIMIEGGEPEVLTLIEQGEDRGVFAAILPDSYSAVAPGTEVTMTYVDADDGAGGFNIEKSASTTAAGEVLPAPIVTVSDLTAPESMFVGQTRKVGITVTNDAASVVAATGEVIIEANGVEVLREAFTDLAPKRKVKVSAKWQAPDDTDIVWTARVEIDGDVVDSVTGTTEVSFRPGNKNANLRLIAVN